MRTSRATVHRTVALDCSNPAQSNKKDHRMVVFFIGRSVGIRTPGLLDPNQARYQTSPHPDSHSIIVMETDSVKRKTYNLPGFPIEIQQEVVA